MAASGRSLSILLAPFGSEGDIRPLLWLAGGLAQRGHRITFVITPYYGHLVERRGWRALPVGTKEEFAETMRDPRLWQPRRGSELVLRLMLASLPRYASVLDGSGENFDLVIATTLGTGALTWAEKRRIPRLMTHLQPMCLRSAYDCPLFLEGWEWLCNSPSFVKRAVFWFFDRTMGHFALGSLNEYRAQMGLRPLRNVEKELWQGADSIAALFPDWYAPPQPDWPKHLRQFGFPRENSATANVAPIPEVVEKFLAAGEPPLLWTHGSANLDTEKFAAGARATTAALGERGLLVGPAFTATSGEDGFLVVPHAPFDRIFSRCRAVVHHGGIGTLVQGLAAGVPQLIVPRAHDQPDNARRLEGIGVGAALAYGKFSGDAAAAKLRALFASPATRAACVKYQQKILETDPLTALCDWAEKLAIKGEA